MKLTDKRIEETIERRVIVEETIERRIFEKSLEERIAALESKFADYIFLSDEQIKEIRDLIQLYYDIYGNKRIWSILRHECKFSKLERVPRYKFPKITKFLYDFVGAPKQEGTHTTKQTLLLGHKETTNKEKRIHKKRVVDTSGCTNILNFTRKWEAIQLD